MAKLLAIPFGRDGFDGDSEFWLPGELSDCREYEEGDTYESLRDAHRASVAADLGDAEAALTEEPAGFWILSEDSYATASVPFSREAGSDGENYAQNSTSKQICARLAVRTLGDASVLTA